MGIITDMQPVQPTLLIYLLSTLLNATNLLKYPLLHMSTTTSATTLALPTNATATARRTIS